MNIIYLINFLYTPYIQLYLHRLTNNAVTGIFHSNIVAINKLGTNNAIKLDSDKQLFKCLY